MYRNVYKHSHTLVCCLCVIWSFFLLTKSAHTHTHTIVCQDKERALKKSTSLFLVILIIILYSIASVAVAVASVVVVVIIISPYVFHARKSISVIVVWKFYELTFQGMTSNRHAGEMTNKRRQQKDSKQQRRMKWQTERREKRKNSTNSNAGTKFLRAFFSLSLSFSGLGKTGISWHTMLMIF